MSEPREVQAPPPSAAELALENERRWLHDDVPLQLDDDQEGEARSPAAP